jgi:NAD(P)-dependent dehydrogenase (short-subunit alcohol dehydrogenase family)
MTSQRLEGRYALLTGGGTGIGRGIAHRLAAEGAELLLVGRRPEVLAEVLDEIEARGGRCSYFAADLRDEDQVQAAVDHAIGLGGRIDILVNNAGVAEDHGFLEIPVDSWDRVHETNLRACFLASQRVARHQVSAAIPGVLIHIASISAHAGEIHFASYCAAKSGLLNLSRSIATEMGRYGIRSNCVSPGFVETPMMAANSTSETLEWLRTSYDRAPLGRIPTVEEVAATVAFLASDDASGITGVDVLVDCGASANSYLVEMFPSSTHPNLS